MTASIYAWLLAAIAALAIGAGGAWEWQGHRYEARIAGMQREDAIEHAKALKGVNEAFADAIKKGDALTRQVAALDESTTKEKAHAQAQIDALRRDVAAGNQRLRVAAVCPRADGDGVPTSTAATGVDDAGAPRLTDDAREGYFTLREQINTVTGQLAALQAYVRAVQASQAGGASGGYPDQ